MSDLMFRTGADAAEQASASTGGKFHRLQYLQIAEGEEATLRLITDRSSLITVAQHGFAPTRPAPDGHDGKWPAKMPAVCRNDPAFKDAGTYPDCGLCVLHAQTKDDRAYKPGIRSWGLAIARVPLLIEGRQVGMKDSMIEVEKDGVSTMVPEVVIMNFAWNNCWANFSAITAEYGTWCDRDYRLKRTGKEKDTEYRPAVLGPATLEGYDHGAINAQRMSLIDGGMAVDDPNMPPPAGEIFDVRNPDHFAKYLPSLDTTPQEFAEKYNNDPQALAQAKVIEIVMERSNDEYYARFFDTRMEQPAPKAKKEEGAAPASATPPPVVESPTVAAGDLDALASRVQGYGGPSAEVAPPEMTPAV